MSKQSLRGIGTGFLLASVITSLYASFVQGHVPVDGIKINALLDNKASKKELEEQATSYEAVIKGLQDEKEEVLGKLDQEMKDKEDLESKLKKAAEQQANAQVSDESTSDSDTGESQSSSDDQAFVIEEGMASSAIADQLQEAGYIEKAEDFQKLVDDWQLAELIQAGSYDLKKGMSVDEIASILTNGAYFYR